MMNFTEMAPILLIICFPVLWIFVSWLLSHMGGWATLSRHYSANEDVPKNMWKNWKSISIQRIVLIPANYSNIVKMVADDDALYLSVFVLFRIGHSTLKLPYNEMTAETKTVLFWTTTKIKMKKAQNVQLTFQEKDVKFIIEKIDA